MGCFWICILHTSRRKLLVLLYLHTLYVLQPVISSVRTAGAPQLALRRSTELEKMSLTDTIGT